jgi:hypothetical protein
LSHKIAAGILVIGLMVILHATIAFWLGFDLVTLSRCRFDLTPIYETFIGAGICVIGLAVKTFLDRNSNYSTANLLKWRGSLAVTGRHRNLGRKPGGDE